MASVIWNEKERRWVMRVSINGHARKFSSSVPGASGKRAVLQKYREYTEGRASSPIIFSDAWAEFLQMIIDKNGPVI